MSSFTFTQVCTLLVFTVPEIVDYPRIWLLWDKSYCRQRKFITKTIVQLQRLCDIGIFLNPLCSSLLVAFCTPPQISTLGLFLNKWLKEQHPEECHRHCQWQGLPSLTQHQQTLLACRLLYRQLKVPLSQGSNSNVFRKPYGRSHIRRLGNSLHIVIVKTKQIIGQNPEKKKKEKKVKKYEIIKGKHQVAAVTSRLNFILTTPISIIIPLQKSV